ncbi:hypothetical protein V5799_026096 [Amblyomma americanum]
MRTAFVLCSSLVTVTGSLCSTITIAAKEALLTHDIVKTDFLLVYGIISYLVFMIMESIFRYNTRGNLVVFVSFLLLLFSAVPRSIRQLWSPQQRVFCWSAVAREMPWPVVIVQSAVQLISRVVEILIGILVKAVMLITSIVSVNTFGEYLISLEPPEVNATLSGNDTALEFDA